MFQSVTWHSGRPFHSNSSFSFCSWRMLSFTVMTSAWQESVRLKIFILLIIFVYFAWMPIVWPSLIPASMLTLSVFGMFVVNFYFLYSLVLARIEWPYRERSGQSGPGTGKPGDFP